MVKYLGETIVDVSTHPIFSKYTSIEWAMFFITTYGQIEGSHHKAWVLDQVARCLLNTPVIVKEAKWDDGSIELRISTATPSQDYKIWLAMRDENQYNYYFGIAP